MCAIGMGHPADFFERSRIGDRAAGIVGACDDDEPRARCHTAAYAIGIKGEGVGEIAIEPVDSSSEQARGAKQGIVARCLDEHVIARLEERRTREEVRAGRALRSRHLLGRDAVARRD